jgi:DNA-binding XRE family transcriptional regulator
MLAQKNPGLTQEEIAEQADVPRQTLGRWMERVPGAFRAVA